MRSASALDVPSTKRAKAIRARKCPALDMARDSAQARSAQHRPSRRCSGGKQLRLVGLGRLRHRSAANADEAEGAAVGLAARQPLAMCQDDVAAPRRMGKPALAGEALEI